eukprot:m.59792 g.59792  ORF g.59792 m.59792 type:complete len:60 (+) comp19128_c0_seq1:624-803(+)
MDRSLQFEECLISAKEEQKAAKVRAAARKAQELEAQNATPAVVKVRMFLCSMHVGAFGV